MGEPDAESLGSWMIAAMFVLNAVAIVLTLWQMTRRQRADVELVDGVATKADVQAVQASLDKHVADDKDSLKEIFDGQRKMIAEIAETKQTAILTHQQVQRVEARLNK